MLTWATVEAALAVSAFSVTLAKASLFETLRESPFVKRVPVLHKLLTCPYCLSHWAAFLVALLLPQTGPLYYLVNVFAIVALAAMFSGVSIKLLHMDQHEQQRLYAAIAQLTHERDHYRETLEKLAE